MSETPTSEHLPATVLGQSGDPAERLWQLWRQGQRPDVDAFLAQVGPLPPDQLAVVLRVDQRQRWQTGERIQVEAYVQRHPILLGHAETLLDLLYNEFLLRQRHGDQPTLAEYRQRFPEHADVLQAQIELDRALDAAPSATQAGSGPAGPPLPAVLSADHTRYDLGPAAGSPDGRQLPPV